MGVDLILIPIVTTKQESMYIFEKKICAQVFQNCVAVAMCNRVGSEGKMDFAGESLMTDAKGQVIVKADDSDFAKNKMKPLYKFNDLRYTIITTIRQKIILILFVHIFNCYC